MCSILCWILSVWEALGCIFCIFGLIHALSTRGRSLSMFWATKCIWKVFRWFRAFFWALCVTGLTGRGHWSDRSWWWSYSYVKHRSDRRWWPVWPVRAELMELLCFHQVFCMHSSRGSCICLGGDCMCAGGALCCFRALVWWVVLFAWA
jgi:hypothetical protein